MAIICTWHLTFRVTPQCVKGIPDIRDQSVNQQNLHNFKHNSLNSSHQSLCAVQQIIMWQPTILCTHIIVDTNLQVCTTQPNVLNVFKLVPSLVNMLKSGHTTPLPPYALCRISQKLLYLVVRMLYITTILAIAGTVKMTFTRTPTIFIIWSKELHDVFTVSRLWPLLIFIFKED